MRTLRAALVASASAARMAPSCAQTPSTHGWTSPTRCWWCLGMLLTCEYNNITPCFREASYKHQDSRQQHNLAYLTCHLQANLPDVRAVLFGEHVRAT
jgi:hypothetical protein